MERKGRSPSLIKFEKKGSTLRTRKAGGKNTEMGKTHFQKAEMYNKLKSESSRIIGRMFWSSGGEREPRREKKKDLCEVGRPSVFINLMRKKVGRQQPKGHSQRI